MYLFRLKHRGCLQDQISHAKFCLEDKQFSEGIAVDLSMLIMWFGKGYEYVMVMS